MGSGVVSCDGVLGVRTRECTTRRKVGGVRSLLVAGRPWDHRNGLVFVAGADVLDGLGDTAEEVAVMEVGHLVPWTSRQLYWVK